MKNTVIALVGCLGLSFFAQSASLQFLGTTVGDEGAPIIRWASESNAVYRIDYASELMSSNTHWQVLYEDYPSHGTNTFWMDNGNYVQEPPVKRPRDNPMRFYRIGKTGTNTAPSPSIEITSPTSSSVLSGEVTVSVAASTSLEVLSTKLFVDGLEMDPSDDGTNFVINTSEWSNGPHALFAIAKAASQREGLPDFYVVNYGRAVSSYVPVVFTNYISRINFSEPYFEPELGQTQKVTAVFSAYSDWTLQVLDENGSAVRTATGSGHAMSFDWDGTGDGGVSIPDGVHEYLVTAVEATEPPPAPGGGGGPPPAPMMAAMASGETSYFVQPPPMPPVKVEGQWYSWEEVYGALPLTEVLIPLAASQSYWHSLSAADSFTVGAMVQAAAPKAPKKPPTKPVKGKAGTFGIAYYKYAGGITNQSPSNGLPGGRVEIQGCAPCSHPFMPLPVMKQAADNFTFRMSKGAWKAGFTKVDPPAIELKRSDAGIGGSNIFNSVDLGLFMSHGAYGTSVDFTQVASQSLQTYFPVAGTNNPADSWIRLSEFKWGSQKLKWMFFAACHALHDDSYQSMKSKGVLPVGDQLHLLLAAETVMLIDPLMNDDLPVELFRNKTLPRAWFDAGRLAYQNQTTTTEAMTLRVSGWDSTLGDTLRFYTVPDPDVDTLTELDEQVWP